MPPTVAAAATSASVAAVANIPASVARNASASTSPGRRLELFESTRRRRKISRLQKQSQKQSGAPSPAPSVRRFDAGACSFDRRQATNLNRLLTLDGEQQRCSVRHLTLEQAGKACAARVECVGVVRDNGIQCSGGVRQFELRGGFVMPQRGHVSWVCASRYKAPVGRVAPSAKGAKAGFVFTLLGSCAKPEYACTHVLELAEAIRSIRALPLLSKYSLAVLSDGGGPTHEWVWEHLKPDIVQPLQPDADDHGDDIRGRKLLAYTQSPFERTVFLDGDTFVRSARVEMLFDALEHFELAAAFECCRVDWGSAHLPYDKAGFFRGWEMQTGVMAQRRSPAVADFWRTAAAIYSSRREMWAKRSSAEQGAATLALAQSSVRFLPLPPAFNARPFTMYTWLQAFGMPVYHGKHLWTHKGLDGKPAEPEAMIRQRMARDWGNALALVKTFQSP